MTSNPADFYGQVSVADIRATYNELRRAIQAGDIEAAQNAFDIYEQWADYIFDARHREYRPSRTTSDARIT